MATSVLKLNYEDAAAVAKLIKPVLHSQGIVSAQSGGKIVVQLRNLTALDAEDALKALAGARPSFKVVAMPGSNNLLLEGEAAELERLKAVLSQMDAGGAAPRGAVSVLPLRFADGGELIEMLNGLLPAYEREGQPLPTVAYDSGSNSLIISARAR